MKLNASSIDFRHATANNLSTWNVNPGITAGRRISMPKIWVEFNGSSTGLYGSSNVQSVNDVAVGEYVINWRLYNSGVQYSYYLPYTVVVANHSELNSSTWASSVFVSSNNSSVTIHTYGGSSKVDPSRVGVVICSGEPITNI